MKRALITGITGQDGYYLTEYLYKLGYEVHGFIRMSPRDLGDIKEFNVKFHYGDITDYQSVVSVLNEVRPHEIYNLAAITNVKNSFSVPSLVVDTNAKSVVHFLEAIRFLELDSKFYQASTSELFGLVQEIPQSETTPFYPRSPYAVSKLHAFWSVVNFREAYGIFACNGILFNHESPKRGEEFVTRKITKGIKRMKDDKNFILELGNLDAKRDWGHAKDYIRMMWLILQQDEPDDYVASSGEFHSVREFIQEAFRVIGIELEFTGSGVDEIGVVKSSSDRNFDVGRKVISVNREYFRPTEVEQLLGDSTKARNELGWKPEFSFKQLVSEMVLKDYL